MHKTISGLDQVSQNTGSVEIWGGAEYSLVRVENDTYDQLERSGHDNRISDLDLFHKLNIKSIRYPLLWEKYEKDKKEFFRTNDKRLNKLKKLGIKPIAGLVHHGSGPFFTDLYDEKFPQLLADYALLISERYPWIEFYCPVNEPLTTARFSGLYGFWYPHRHDDHSFVRIFLNELKGIVLSMKAIRSVNPHARLIQTEDLGKIHHTDTLKYQADFENYRSWLTYDILTGRLDADHIMWNYFLDSGVKPHELEFFIENPCEPYICGFNYYITSERFLDHRKWIYPVFSHGTNGFHEYADIEAVRANFPIRTGSDTLLREAWERYHLPIALTEVHLGCTREEQLRWFYEAYNNAILLREEGVDFRAITAWSFFGSYDWSSLLCRKENHYESGVYDIRSGTPRPTALASLIKSINNGDGSINNGDDSAFRNILKIPGWWKRSDRFIYKNENENINVNSADYVSEDVAPLLIIGATGSLGNAFARICEQRGIVHYLSGRDELDIASAESVNSFLESKKPWAVINAAGFTRIDDAERYSFKCFRDNTTGPVILSEACKSSGIKLVTFSTDQVFNGKKRDPYTEEDQTNPLNLYGLSKRLAEEKVLRTNPGALVVRSSTFFNPWHRDDILGRIIRSGIESGHKYFLASDIIISPAYVPDLVNAVLDLLIDNESGIWHLSNQEEFSHYEFARMVLSIAGLDESVISPVPFSKLRKQAVRPQYSVLKSSAGFILPSINNAITNFLNEYYREPSLEIMNQPSL
jgi:dTDP-4-dehydrorhamnose reductase